MIAAIRGTGTGYRHGVPARGTGTPRVIHRRVLSAIHNAEAPPILPARQPTPTQARQVKQKKAALRPANPRDRGCLFWPIPTSVALFFRPHDPVNTDTNHE